MNKEIYVNLLLTLIELEKSIQNTENSIFPKEYLEDGYVILKDIRKSAKKIYQIIDKTGNEDGTRDLIEIFNEIVENGYEYLDFDLLTQEQKEENKIEYKVGTISLTKDGMDFSFDENSKIEKELFISMSDINKYPNAIVKFKNDEEIAKYLIDKYI